MTAGPFSLRHRSEASLNARKDSKKSTLLTALEQTIQKKFNIGEAFCVSV